MAEKAPKKAVKARAIKRAPAQRAVAPEAPAKPRARTPPSKAPAPPRRRSPPKPVTAPPLAEPSRASRPARRRPTKAATAPPAVMIVVAAHEAPASALTEEERIESSKYDVREPQRPRRVFEEERFLFPETYESDRVRLLVKDPEWLFAHWDVSPSTLQRLRDDMGERATALSRLTLRLEDPAESALSVVLLPEGARSWYVRTHSTHRAYRAALGVTMPSGEFRPLATSNVVVAPGGSPSPQRARRRVGFSRAQSVQAAAELEQRGAIGTNGGERKSAAHGAAEADSVDYIDGSAVSSQSEQSTQRGGASDALGPGGASDVFRR